jgi:hypothetical protein
VVLLISPQPSALEIVPVARAILDRVPSLEARTFTTRCSVAYLKLCLSMVVVVAEIIASPGPANREVIGATSIHPAVPTVGVLAPAPVGDASVHIEYQRFV